MEHNDRMINVVPIRLPTSIIMLETEVNLLELPPKSRLHRVIGPDWWASHVLAVFLWHFLPIFASSFFPVSQIPKSV